MANEAGVTEIGLSDERIFYHSHFSHMIWFVLMLHRFYNYSLTCSEAVTEGVVNYVYSHVHIYKPPSPPPDIIRVMVIVWRLRVNIIRTALCWIM